MDSSLICIITIIAKTDLDYKMPVPKHRCMKVQIELSHTSALHWPQLLNKVTIPQQRSFMHTTVWLEDVKTPQTASSWHLTFPNILSDIRLHHWQTCGYLSLIDLLLQSESLTKHMSWNSLILTVLLHREQWDMSARGSLLSATWYSY